MIGAFKRWVVGLAAGLSLLAQPAERFLDAPRPAGDGVRLVVFNPTAYNLRCLAALRDEGILAVPGLTVVGVYHVRQQGDFAAARAFVAERHLDWVRFHVIPATLQEADVFRENACTPEFKAMVARADGALFLGGSDIPAALFQQKHNLLSEVDDPYRNYLELSAIFHLLGDGRGGGPRPLLADRPGFAILGICLGFQSLNVGTGGSLVQDIWSGIYHVSSVEDAIALGPERWHNNPYRRLHPLDKLMPYNFHSLRLSPSGRFVRELGFAPGDHPRVLSSHHQALGRLGAGWSVAATSRDGKVVEAIQHRRFPKVLGVQFHPEHHLLWDLSLQIRQKPEDPPTSYHAILAGTPPSLAFNKAIWAWYGRALLDSRGR